MDKPPPFTRIHRPPDPRYPTNLAILIIAAAAPAPIGLWRLFQGQAILSIAWWGFQAGAAIFFAWTIARELDPERELAAFVPAGLAILAVIFLALPDLLLLLWFIFLLRIINRTSGLTASILDSVLTLILTLAIVWTGGWIAGLGMAAVLLLDARLSEPHRPHRIYAVLALLVTAGLGIWRSGAGAMAGLSIPALAASLSILAIFGTVVSGSRTVRAVADYTGQPLDPARVRAGQVVCGLVALGYALWFGEAGFIALAPVWAAMLGLGLSRLVLLLTRSRG